MNPIEYDEREFFTSEDTCTHEEHDFSSCELPCPKCFYGPHIRCATEMGSICVTCKTEMFDA